MFGLGKNLSWFVIIFCGLTIFSCNQKTDKRVDETGNLLFKEKANDGEIQSKDNQIKYWEPLLFSKINEGLKDVNLPSLKDKKISIGNLEVRLWIGFDESELKGLILEKDADNWNCLYLSKNAKGKNNLTKLNEPKNGWNNLWNELNKNDFLRLPDITESENNLFPDARLIVVEIKTFQQYRNYLQIENINTENYKKLQTPSSMKLTSVCNLLSTEFDVSIC